MESLYSPLTPSMDDHFATVFAPTTVYTQLSHDKEDTQRAMTDYREILKQFEENADTSKQDQGETIENGPELEDIDATVRKGKNILIEELRNNNSLMDKKHNLEDLQVMAKSFCVEFQQRLLQLRDMAELCECSVTDVSDGMIYSIECLFDAVKATSNDKLVELKKKISKSKHIITSLCRTYHILKNTNVGPACPICLHSPVNIFCNPCGHSFCKKCLESAKYCYICRVKIDKLHPLYFP